MTQLRLLACFAHPDDEAFTGSGVLAASTARGVRTRLICATSGEEGDIRHQGIATRETLGQIRHQELRRSCAVLGIEEPVMLGYRDSGWADSPAQFHPQAFVQAPALQVLERLVTEMRRFKPHIVLTFEPEGISGHKDHKAISRHTTTAVRLAGDPTVFPAHRQAGLLPHHTARLLYVARPQGFRLQRASLLRQAGLDVPLPDAALHLQGVPLEALHIQLDVTPYLDTKLASMRCHASQLTPEWSCDQVPRDIAAALLGQEYLIQALPDTPPGPPLATDFLEGLLPVPGAPAMPPLL